MSSGVVGARLVAVPLLGCDDALPRPVARVLVAGTSGSGKTALARRVADVLQVPHTELDGLFHGPGWQPRPSFVHDVEHLSAAPAWVTEWQYDEVRPLLAARCDLVVWLDVSRWTVLRQVTARTVSRRLRRQTLWNGNREPPLWTALRDDDHVVRWAWSSHPGTARRVLRLLEEQPTLPVVRLRTHQEADRWLTGPLAASVEPAPG